MQRYLVSVCVHGIEVADICTTARIKTNNERPYDLDHHGAADAAEEIRVSLMGVVDDLGSGCFTTGKSRGQNGRANWKQRAKNVTAAERKLEET